MGNGGEGVGKLDWGGVIGVLCAPVVLFAVVRGGTHARGIGRRARFRLTAGGFAARVTFAAVFRGGQHA